MIKKTIARMTKIYKLAMKLYVFAMHLRTVEFQKLLNIQLRIANIKYTPHMHCCVWRKKVYTDNHITIACNIVIFFVTVYIE